MGIVKLLMPRFMYYRKYLPTNRNWRSNAALGLVQTTTLTGLAYYIASRYAFISPKCGEEYVDPNKKMSRIVPIL